MSVLVLEPQVSFSLAFRAACGGGAYSVRGFARFVRRSRPGDELTELLWVSGPALRTTTPAPFFQPFTCSAAGSSRAHELDDKRHAAMDDDDAAALGGVPAHVHHHHLLHDEGAVPWLHCPVIDDADSDTAPLPPEYCASLLSSGYSSLHDAPEPADPTAPGTARLSSIGGAAVVVSPTQPQPSAGGGGEGVMNFTFFSRPLQRPQTSAAASPSIPLESTVVQTAASRLRNTPLFSEQRMAWLQPPKAPRAAVAPPAPHATPPATDHRRAHVEAAATVTQPRVRPDATAAVTTSSVCSANGDRSHQAKRSSDQPTAECSISQDEDVDDEPSAARRSAARGTKRSRTAEVHNLSERRRRDRINEKMRALQELIPNCNKIDKASMLEEAIEYLKTLQLQVQMMSMGAGGLCVPPPAMLMQMQMQMQAFPHLGMGLAGFGMGAAAFDMLPRFAAGPQFPCPAMSPMVMTHGFGMPGGGGQVGMPPVPAPFLHANGGAAPAPAEQRENAAAVPAPGGAAAGAGDRPPVPVAPQVDQQQPKQT